MSFRFCHFVLHLYCVTYYFVVFDWKNLQSERLYALIPVSITYCTHTMKICPFSDLHIVTHGTSLIQLDCEKVPFASKYTFESPTSQSADENQRTATIFESQVN